jgi:hypothetical protein
VDETAREGEVVEVAPGEYVALPDGLNEPAALLGGVMDTARPPCR